MGRQLDPIVYWAGLRGEDEKFLAGWLMWRHPAFRSTIEGLSAYRAYKSLPREDGLRYASYSSFLFDVFFNLSGDQLVAVERTLPPYPRVWEMALEGRGLTWEEIEVLRSRLPLNPFRALRLARERERILERRGLVSGEYRLILERQRLEDWRVMEKALGAFYGVTGISVLFSTGSFLAMLLYVLSFPLPYLGLRRLALQYGGRRLRRYVNAVLAVYGFARSPFGVLIGGLEYGVLSPMLARIVERFWGSRRFPGWLRERLYGAQLAVSGLRAGRFDERDIRDRLLGLRIGSPGIPRSAVERFREEVESGYIEVVDIRRALLDPWALSWYRRRVVAVQEGRDVKIVDKDFVRMLAEREGMGLGEMEDRVRKWPLMYLGFDYWNGRPAYTRDVIGVLPCEIVDGLLYKEGYTAVLGKRADEIVEKRMLLDTHVVGKLASGGRTFLGDFRGEPW